MRKLAILIALVLLGAGAGLAATGELPAWRHGGARAMERDPLAPLPGTIAPLPPGPTILCRGDSNVRGSGGWRPWGRTPPVRPWCDWLAESLGARAVNRGVGGDTVAMGLARGRTVQAADLVVLLYGANDAAARGLLGTRRPVAPDAFRTDLAAMIRQHGASRVLVLAAPPTASRAMERRIAPYRRAAREVALTEGAAFLDPAEALGGGQVVLDRDGLHLNAAGHRILGLWLAKWLEKGRAGAIAP